MRFSENEHTLLDERAEAAKLPKSTYVRIATLKTKLPQQKSRPAISAPDREELLRAYHALRESGLVKSANVIAIALSKGQALATVIEKTALLNHCADIKAIRSAIEKALSHYL